MSPAAERARRWAAVAAAGLFGAACVTVVRQVAVEEAAVEEAAAADVPATETGSSSEAPMASCSPCALHGEVDPQGVTDRAPGTLAGIQVMPLDRAEQAVSTDSNGTWSLTMPGGLSVVEARGDAFVPGIAAVPRTWLDDPTRSVRVNVLVLAETAELHRTKFDTERDPERGFVVVIAVGPTAADVVDAEMTLDLAHPQAFGITEALVPVPGNRTIFHSQVFFPNTTAGAANATVVTAKGQPCLGPRDVPVRASTVTTIYFDCP